MKYVGISPMAWNNFVRPACSYAMANISWKSKMLSYEKFAKMLRSAPLPYLVGRKVHLYNNMHFHVMSMVFSNLEIGREDVPVSQVNMSSSGG
jgi:hypothetical protein